MKEIPLTQGKVAFVDDEDYPAVASFKWYAAYTPHGRCWYAARGNGKGSMHRWLMQAPPGMTVDHIDGNPLNNTRANLRLATPKENSRNAKKARLETAKSKYKGVNLEQDGRWVSRIIVDRKVVNLGRYDDERLAAAAYDLAAKQYFGEFARLNAILYPNDLVGIGQKEVEAARRPYRGRKLRLTEEGLLAIRMAGQRRALPPKLCALCGREFAPTRRASRFCSRRCLWSRDRTGER